MDGRRPILIAGGGIAGLTAALAFARSGFSVEIYERAEQFEAIGAGLQLSPNATRLLGPLGVLDRLEARASRPEAVVLRRAADLRVLATVPLGAAAERRWGAPYLVVHRADLHAALAGEAGARSDRIRLVAGHAATAVQADGDHPTLSVADGRPPHAGLLIIGADGVHSLCRSATHLAAAHRFVGQIAWRATVAAASEAGNRLASLGAQSVVSAFLHPQAHLIVYPIARGEAFNLVTFTRGSEAETAMPAVQQRMNPVKALRGAAEAISELATLAGPWTAWPVHAVDRRAAWTAGGGLALIGDAAHAMTPFAAQGAAMAIEDAVTLADAVAACSAPTAMAAALAGWEAARRPRIEAVARRGAFNRLAWHAAGPIALMRNAVLRWRSPEALAADLDWLYGWRP